MIEPEVAFLELDGLLNLAEGFITHIVTTVLAHHRADLKVIGKDIAKLEAVIAPATNNDSATEPGAPSSPAHLRAKVGGSATEPNKFPRLSYDEAHAMLDEAFKAGKIEAPHKYGDDFGSPDETYISSQFDKPVMIHRYPAAFKAFYMQPDPLDPTKALCVDVLAPEGYGEIIGGSQRIDSYDLLKSRIEQHNLPLEAFQWYLDLRKYGSVPHSGFGMGIERAVAWICGLDHVRETIPFARTLNRIYP
jgi:asparaginyl-tRNA synthetase